MSDDEKQAIFQGLTLGQKTDYCSSYSPELLQGADIWHAYELSWLNDKGKPVVALARCSVPYDTPNIIESKSFKLYLNSLNQSRFNSQQEVLQLLVNDLSATAGGSVSVELFAPDDINAFPVSKLSGTCIDHLDVEIDEFALNPSLLMLESSTQNIEETVHSHLLKSNCLITNQPDWASVVISYRGQKIDHAALLRYLISFRMHNEFHEQCVERIFMDIKAACMPESLTVQALYTRRGGLDINPFRSSEKHNLAPFRRINRQ